ncbi:MAG: transposase [Candidatus Cloacimonadota bacterium]|nr:transposase [Candidatus Cloacimonadota bacterium]
MKRKNSLRLESYDYSWSGAYFITICSYKREEIFGEIENGLMHLNNAGNIINDCWYQIPKNYEKIKLDDFVIMPNHIHGIIWIVGAIHESPEKNQMIHESPIVKRKIHESPDATQAIHESPKVKRKIHESPRLKETILESSKDNSSQNKGVIRELPLRIERRKMKISKIIGRFKMNSSKLINDIHNSKGYHVWQRSYYDHIIRNKNDLNNKKQYIQNNPSNWEIDEYSCLG